MKKISLALALSSVVMGGSTAFAQQSDRCGNDIFLKAALSSNPSLESAYKKYLTDSKAKADAFEQEMSNSAQKATGTVMIPVMFHVILTQEEIDKIGGIAGINKRVISQLDVINTDYNARNTDTATIPTPFKPLLGNMNVNFQLAHRKPDGTVTSGVEVRVAPLLFGGYSSYPSGSDSAKKTSKGGLDPYDNTKYLNIWVVNINSDNGNVLGIGYSPDFAAALGAPDNAGVLLDFSAFGKRTPGVPGFSEYYESGADKGRTLTHELGHFFTLWHIWGNTAVGSGNCTDDDDIGDTPKQKDATTSCQTFPYTDACTAGNGIMFMNYMDYVGDACYRLFTKGQVSRMQSTIASGGTAYGLTQHPELTMYPTAVSNIEESANLNIFPNPTTGLFDISFGNAQSLKEVRVLNMTGQVVSKVGGSQVNGNTVRIDLNNNAKGIYIVQCQFEEGTVVRKITLQ